MKFFDRLSCFIYGMVLGVILSAVSWSICVQSIRQQAVDHGAAEWRCDNKGNVTFEWKEKP